MKGQGILMNPFSRERRRRRGEGTSNFLPATQHGVAFASVRVRQVLTDRDRVGLRSKCIIILYPHMHTLALCRPSRVLPLHGMMNSQYFLSPLSGRSSNQQSACRRMDKYKGAVTFFSAGDWGALLASVYQSKSIRAP